METPIVVGATKNKGCMDTTDLCKDMFINPEKYKLLHTPIDNSWEERPIDIFKKAKNEANTKDKGI